MRTFVNPTDGTVLEPGGIAVGPSDSWIKVQCQ